MTTTFYASTTIAIDGDDAVDGLPETPWIKLTTRAHAGEVLAALGYDDNFHGTVDAGEFADRLRKIRFVDDDKRAAVVSALWNVVFHAFENGGTVSWV